MVMRSSAESQTRSANGEHRGLWPTRKHSPRYLDTLLKGWTPGVRRVKRHEVSGKAKPSGPPTRPLGNDTSEFPFSFVPLPCGCISFPGKEIMPHPFLPLLQQFPSSHHSHGGASGQSREGPPPFHSSWGVKEAWGLSKEEMFSLLGMRVMPGEGRDTFPLRCKLLLL